VACRSRKLGGWLGRGIWVWQRAATSVAHRLYCSDPSGRFCPTGARGPRWRCTDPTARIDDEMPSPRCKLPFHLRGLKWGRRILKLYEGGSKSAMGRVQETIDLNNAVRGMLQGQGIGRNKARHASATRSRQRTTSAKTGAKVEAKFVC
jgi:hypothetical protein